ncbi:FliA/WhiG family RNA polymerase sigma factor [Alkalicoccus chagannorensis]|uniref:FliA/WhiG family RNA polymerase sigma factor n=1 Tax=Alkalicoccus chagannorensis TaxID=427072 RepID=UPI00040AF2B2|nr:FliA/WhiG family RNA polymerase sigma factor [Alkalicoccus chagannorensis]
MHYGGAELKKYWNSWLDNQSTDAADRILEAYMPLVDYHVQRIKIHLPKSIRADDLRSHGMIGLYDALEKFDSSRDLKFDTYASFRIRGAIMDGLRQEDWLPRSVRDRAKKVDQAVEKLEQRLGRNASPEEVAEETGLKTSDVLQTMNDSFFSHLLSIDESTGSEDGEETYASVIADQKSAAPEDSLLFEASRQELAERIKQLNEKEQLVIALFYQEEMTLTEIGEIMGLSTSRISQIHSKCIYKLKHFYADAQD